MILATGHMKVVRVLAWGAVSLLVAMLAASRVVLGLHSTPEVVIGVGIGGACLFIFKLLLAKRSLPQNAGQLVALVLLIIVVRTSHVDGEALVSRIADEMRAARKVTSGMDAQLVRSSTDDQTSAPAAQAAR